MFLRYILLFPSLIFLPHSFPPSSRGWVGSSGGYVSRRSDRKLHIITSTFLTQRTQPSLSLWILVAVHFFSSCSSKYHKGINRHGVISFWVSNPSLFYSILFSLSLFFASVFIKIPKQRTIASMFSSFSVQGASLQDHQGSRTAWQSSLWYSSHIFVFFSSCNSKIWLIRWSMRRVRGNDVK